MRFLGFGAKKKRDFQSTLDALLAKSISLEFALSLYANVAQTAIQGQPVTQEFEAETFQGTYLVFIVTAPEGIELARATMADLEKRSVDFSAVTENEYLVLLEALNALLAAESIADALLNAEDRRATFKSPFYVEDNPLRKPLRELMRFGRLAREIRDTRESQSPENYRAFLEHVVRPQIPEGIIQLGLEVFAGFAGR